MTNLHDEHAGSPAAWQPAVRQALREAAERQLRDRYGAGEVSFNYRWEHVQTVVALALKLAALTGADAEVVEAAAWLHDICKERRERHPQEGAQFARRFLPHTDFPVDKIERVATAIEDHMGLWRDEPLTDLESMVLWDADKLSKIGLTAVFHWTGGALAGGERKGLKDLIARGRAADWQQKMVASLHMEPARRAAQMRLAHYNWVWDTLEMELRGADLTI